MVESVQLRDRESGSLRASLTALRSRARSRLKGTRRQRTLLDRRADALLRRRGYVVVDLLSTDTVSDLLDTAMSIHPAPPAGWSADFYSSNGDLKRQVNELIERSMAEPLRRILTGHRSVLHSFVINAPGPGGGLRLHQHSSVVDEERFRSVVVWCAITPATEENGTLHVVPQSHLLQVGPRPERSSSWGDAHEATLLRDHLDSVPLEPGQAIVFDNQLLHCSFPNSTDESRISAVAVVAPHDADLLYYEESETAPDRVRIYRLEPEFFLNNTAGELQWARPDGLELAEERPWEPTEIDAELLASTLPPGNCRHLHAGIRSPD